MHTATPGYKTLSSVLLLLHHWHMHQTVLLLISEHCNADVFHSAFKLAVIIVCPSCFLQAHKEVGSSFVG